MLGFHWTAWMLNLLESREGNVGGVSSKHGVSASFNSEPKKKVCKDLPMLLVSAKPSPKVSVPSDPPIHPNKKNP